MLVVVRGGKQVSKCTRAKPIQASSRPFVEPTAPRIVLQALTNHTINRPHSMKLTASALGAALAMLLLGLAAADACPTLRVTTRAPKNVRNNKVYTVKLAVRNTGTTAAIDLQIAVRVCGRAGLCAGFGRRMDCRG
jgi:hypothetical protein